MRQISILLRSELCNIFDINVFRHLKDSQEKRRRTAIGATIVLGLGVIFAFLVGFCNSLAGIDATDIIPSYMIALSSFIVFFFNLFKASGYYFKRKGYDIIASMPVPAYVVVLSRGARLYLESLFVTLILNLPGTIVYANHIDENASFYLWTVLTLLVAPLLPLALASVISLLINSISLRMKNKAIVEAVFTIIVFLVFLFAFMSTFMSKDGITYDRLKDIVDIITGMIKNIYPLAIMAGNAIVFNDVVDGLLFMGISAVAFLVVECVLSVGYRQIMQSLYNYKAKYGTEEQTFESNSVLSSLIKKEAKRYFSSGVYVTNTAAGPIMGLIFSIAVCFVDFSKYLDKVPIEIDLVSVIPMVVSAIFCVMMTSPVSISMEGKEWWIIKSMPLHMKDVVVAKVAFSLLLVGPFLLISEVVMFCFLKLTILQRVFLFILPVLSVVCSSIYGVFVNILLPKFDWDSEITVVKQSISSVIGGLGIPLLCVIAAMLAIAVGKENTLYVYFGSCFVFISLIILLYSSAANKSIQNI